MGWSCVPDGGQPHVKATVYHEIRVFPISFFLDLSFDEMQLFYTYFSNKSQQERRSPFKS